MSSADKKAEHSDQPFGMHSDRREHLAHLLMNHFPVLEKVAQRKLTNRTRGVHDGADVASSVLRRIDMLAQEGRLAGMTDDQVVAFAVTIASNQAVSRTRSMERLATHLREDGEYARLLHDRLGRLDDDEQATMLLCRIALSIEDSASRQLFLLRWKGLSFPIIAQLLRITPEAARQRWSALRKILEARLRGGELDERL